MDIKKIVEAFVAAIGGKFSEKFKEFESFVVTELQLALSQSPAKREAIGYILYKLGCFILKLAGESTQAKKNKIKAGLVSILKIPTW